MTSIKPGYQSTEAWASLLASVFVMVNLPPAQSLAIVAGISGLYTLGRSIVKSFQR